MKINKHYIVIAILIFTMGIVFLLPKPKYLSPNILSKLDIPYVADNWKGEDLEDEVMAQALEANFISQIFARKYINNNGDIVYLTILDAGNFHHPKVCFGSSGYSPQDLRPTELNIRNHYVKAPTLLMRKDKESVLIIYWICINKKITDWTGQKIQQAIYSMFNKQKIGLMIRIDVPTDPNNTERAYKAADDFLKSITPLIPDDQLDYIFGE